MLTLFHCPNVHASKIIDGNTPPTCGTCDATMTKGKFGKPSPYHAVATASQSTARIVPPASAPTASVPVPFVPASPGRVDTTATRTRRARTDPTRTPKAKRAAKAKAAARARTR